MILTVTLNPALDSTYEVEFLEPDQSHRVLTVHVRAGGKGINVARVLCALGQPAVVTGLVGGVSGAELRADLADTPGLVDELVSVSGQTRRTVAVVSRARSDATVFNEPGPLISAAEWDEFTRRYEELVREAELVVLSGSLPPGVPVDGYGRLVRAARSAGRKTVLDTAGPALVEALGAEPTVVKPNETELAAAIAHAFSGACAHDSALGAAEAGVAHCDAMQLIRRGAESVVVSLGPRGLYACTPQGLWRAAPPEAVAGNPTGAGDACVAAIAAGLAAGSDWPGILREAVALSAAAVLSPVAGAFDAGQYRRFRTAVSVIPVEENHAAQPDR